MSERENSGLAPVEQLSEVLKACKISIRSFNPDKDRGIGLNGGGSTTVQKISERIRETLKGKIVKYPALVEALYDTGEMVDLFTEYAEGELEEVQEGQVVIPEEYKDLTIYIDAASQNRVEYFLATKDHILSPVSGIVYMRASGLKEEMVNPIAPRVFKEYRPRSPLGVTEEKTAEGLTYPIFNTYVPPSWINYDRKTPPGPPGLFTQLIEHLFPSKKEREYFLDWLYESLFNRAFVYLILCGAGGIGKNRLKAVLRALHGHINAIDGKKSTLSDRFNSQLENATLIWFDELKFDHDMENPMKEIQNDSISIERKGKDATRSTRIYASFVISNNKPRDNYIALDARKFVPLQLTNKRLETSMSMIDIGKLSRKVENWDHPDYDIEFIAQIARWLKKRGNSGKYPQLEYKGPMFYKLAHTSLARWQKKAASLLLSGQLESNQRILIDDTKGYLWSSVDEFSHKKNGDRSLTFPDFSSVKHFFDIFIDGNGKPVFKTELVEEDVMGDFYVKLLNPKAKIITEQQVVADLGEEDEEVDPEEYDL